MIMAYKFSGLYAFPVYLVQSTLKYFIWQVKISPDTAKAVWHSIPMNRLGSKTRS